MIEMYNKTLKETIYKEILDNGLTVYLCRKKDYKLKQAIFSVDFGGNDIEFIPYNSNEYYKAPLGVAHFLEHKLFTKEDGSDVMEDFSKLGCSSNAYTTDIRTSYYFSGTNNFKEALILLLDFVQTPHFTDESVERERGIIEQEILNYVDNPYSVIDKNLLMSLYEKNGIRNDVGGTVESIQEITKEVLDLCYKTFYHPKNMSLSVVGDFDVNEILEIIKENQNSKTFLEYKNPNSIVYREEMKVFKKKTEIEFDVNVPLVEVGLKLPALNNLSSKEVCKRYYSYAMLIDQSFYDISDFYQKMLEKGIFNNSFECYSSFSEDYSYLKLFCETEKYNEFIECVVNRLNLIRTIDFTKEDFYFLKRCYLAEQINSYSSVSALAFLADSLHENYQDINDIIDSIKELTYEEVLLARKDFIDDAISICILKSNNSEQ